MTATPTTQELLAELAESRQKLQEAKDARTKLELELKSSMRWLLVSDAVAYHSARVSELTALIQADGLAAYAKTGSKKPWPGVMVKTFSVLKYDLVQALDWARKNLPEALTLDQKFFEEHAKGVAKTTPIPIVKIVEEPRAQIDSDLSQYLPQEKTA